MRHLSSLPAAIVSAVLAAAITAGVMLSVSGGAAQPDGGHDGGPRNIALPTPELETLQPTPKVPIEPGEPLLEPGFAAADWSQAYAVAVLSLVTVVTDDGSGSGFFVSEDGHVMTNLHVLGENERVVIITQDGSRVEGELVARDIGNDLALIKIDPDGIEVVLPSYGSLDDLRIGDPVGALGAPYALPNTLTVGIVSGLGRLRQSGNRTTEPLRNTIQTDAALNPGNSGGMLIDARGRVVGIPTQIETPDQTWSGIGFAVSADAMLRSLPTMLTGEDAERSYLGVSFDTSDGGLAVADVICDSPADEAGLRDGDVVLAINDEEAVTLDQLMERMASLIPGDDLTITVRRGARSLTLNATAGNWPATLAGSGCG
ncbi:MAG: PDZ domain-containing protein [Chloroflexi bacterium]|nr:PDZ domain-containing protein [Chloroflexota bacterium]MYD17455.1 PDZ domain-containing protein [Chloroflexota bacterium]